MAFDFGRRSKLAARSLTERKESDFMEQETTANYQNRTEKVYKDREIWVATLLGGTLAAGYMVAKNYRAFGETDKIWKTWLATVAATAFVLLVSFAPYIDRLPNHLFSLVCAGIIVVLVQMYQGEKIRTHVRAGGRIQSWWKTLGVSMAGFCITVILFVGAAAVVTVVEEYNAASKTYGKMQHEIYYNKNNISESEVDRIADVSIKSNLFLDSQGKWYAYARKVDTDYEISLSVSRTTLNDRDYLKFFAEERGYIQAYFPNNKIIINLVEGNFDKVEKRIE